MKSAKCFFLLILIFNISGAGPIDCDDKALEKKAVYELPGGGYWMQAAGDCRITYTAIAGVFSRMYNVCTRKAEPITNYTDAFGLPEGDLYVHPHKGISFFKVEDTLKQNGSNQPIYTDNQHTGNYQSIGKLDGSTPERRLVRIAMGNAAGAIRDYAVEKKEGVYSITPIQDKVTQICRNQPFNGLDSETPVLSRDGKMIASRQLGSRKMQIFKISMPSGDCELVREIPLATSKVSFMFDNKSVLYTIKDPLSHKGRLLKMDIESGDIQTLSGPDEDVFYMTAREDGTIFYNRKSSFISLLSSQLVEIGPGEVDATSKLTAYEAVGLMWGDACGKKIDADYAIAVAMRLNKKNCEAVVTSANMSKLEEDYADLSKSELLAACKGTSPIKPKGAKEVK